MARFSGRTLIEGLEPRTLYAVDAGNLLTAVPPLASQSFLLSQAGGALPAQLNSNEGVAIALSLQPGSALDLTGTRPTPFLARTFFLERVQVPQLLPDSMGTAPSVR